MAEIQTEILCFHTKGAAKSIFLCPSQNTEYSEPCLLFLQTTNKQEKPRKNSLLVIPLSFIRQIKVMFVATTTQTEKKPVRIATNYNSSRQICWQYSVPCSLFP